MTMKFEAISNTKKSQVYFFLIPKTTTQMTYFLYMKHQERGKQVARDKEKCEEY